MLAEALGLIGKSVENKLVEMGTDVLFNATPLGAILGTTSRISEALESGGVSEVERLGKNWLRAPQLPSGAGFLGRIDEALRKRGHRGGWQETTWAWSHQDWVANKWRHDWRTQPREPAGSSRMIWVHRGPYSFQRGAGGDWIEGRLDEPALGAPRIGRGKSGISRKGRKLLRVRRAYRREGANAVKGIFSSWRNDGH